MSIIVTGGDGYIGWPTALRIASRTDERVLAVDNLARRGWVEAVGATSATPVAGPDERLAAAREVHGCANLSFAEGDLAERSFIDELLGVHEPSTVVHMAAQPSAPYSQINGERANYTQHNNMQATRNLLFGLHEQGLTDTHFIETTTTGIYGAPDFPIPEGGATMEHAGERDEVPFPGMGGSWYHQSKSHDAANLRLAAEQFDLPVSDVRTAITYGTETDETRADDRLTTRLDFDYYFGVVAHRFAAQAVAGYPLTVYGKGEQRKPFVALEDAVEGLAELACGDDTAPAHGDSPAVYNQVTRPIAIVEIAETIRDAAAGFDLDIEVTHVENPRDEDETHRMEIDNDRYIELIGGQETAFAEGIEDVIGTLVRYRDTITAHEDRFLPDALQE